MSGFEYLVISVLAPTLKSSADTINDIKKRSKKRKGDYGLYEHELAKSLGEAWYQIRTSFYAHVGRLEPYQLGGAFRRGDEISSQRIQFHIMEAKSVKSSIDLASQYKHDIDDIRTRWRCAEGILRDVKQVMDDLAVRISQSNTPAAAPAPRPSSSIPQTSAPVAVPQPHSTSFPSSGRPISLSTAMSNSPVDSIPSAGPPPYQDFAPNHSPFPDYATAQHTLSPGSPSNRLSGVSQDRGSRGSFLARRRNSGASFNTTSTTESQGSRRPAAPRTSSQTLSGGSIMNNGRSATLSGRPEKKNGFHGFCEGAWTSQRDPKEGMQFMSIPDGLNSPLVFLQCHKCRFRATAYGPDKRHATMDPKARKASCGIQYRFQFLAKSHEKCKDMRSWGENLEQRMAVHAPYGCVFCYAEGRPTDTFGGVESLMNHIFFEHSTKLSSDIQQRMNCIWGRTADPREAFDINIPAISPPTPEEIPEPVELDLTPLSIAELPSSKSDAVFLGSNMSGPVELDGNAITRISQY